jgi:hypothetical protein
MKKFMFSLIFLGAGVLSTQVSANSFEASVLFIETSQGEILEMPAFMEPHIEELIPGEQIKLGTFYDTFDPAHLFRVLLCITKPEADEPFPFELN